MSARRLNTDELWKLLLTGPQAARCASSSDDVVDGRCKARVRWSTSGSCVQRQCRIQTPQGQEFCWTHQQMRERMTDHDRATLVYKPVTDTSYDARLWAKLTASNIAKEYGRQQDNFVRKVGDIIQQMQHTYRERVLAIQNLERAQEACRKEMERHEASHQTSTDEIRLLQDKLGAGIGERAVLLADIEVLRTEQKTASAKLVELADRIQLSGKEILSLQKQNTDLQEDVHELQDTHLINLEQPFLARGTNDKLGLDEFTGHESCLSWLAECSVELYNHQTRAAARFMRGLRADRNAMLILHDTGFGKTYTAAAIAKCLSAKREIVRAVLVRVNRHAASQFQTAWDLAKGSNTDFVIEVSTMQDLAKRTQEQLARTLVIIDEADDLVRSAASEKDRAKWANCLRQRGVYTVCTTATPFTDGPGPNQWAVLRQLCTLLSITVPTDLTDDVPVRTAMAYLKDHVDVQYTLDTTVLPVLVENTRETGKGSIPRLEHVRQILAATPHRTSGPYGRKVLVYTGETLGEGDGFDIYTGDDRLAEFARLLPKQDGQPIVVGRMTSSSKSAWTSVGVTDIILLTRPKTLASFWQVIGRARRLDSHPLEKGYKIHLTEHYKTGDPHFGPYTALHTEWENATTETV